ncbi:DUF2726 domain-containing protein [Patescibacteria group bacterium]|nr:MAG: DUF2726 domain-containing protein [Patescibacteria group bacterium]
MAIFRYKHKDHIMTDTEHVFFKLLERIVGNRYYIFPQIHLGTIVKPSVRWTYGWFLWRRAFFFSDKYSIDFLLCDRNETAPSIAIELDDKSHLREKRRYRDQVVSKILLESNLRLLRFTVTESLDPDLVKSRLMD